MRLATLARFVLIVSLALGCSNQQEKATAGSITKIQIVVTEPDEHFGHNVDESSGHSIWCDGCSARIHLTGEPFVVYWINNAIKNSDYRFEKGQKYNISFEGGIGKGVMGLEGMCIGLEQVKAVSKL
jgi:hypothetical protein